jgi:hypothetical protein
MDSAVLSLTCAGLGASQEDEDGAVIGYAKSDHCLGTPASCVSSVMASVLTPSPFLIGWRVFPG